ncbi:uncharacterized protein LOC113642200 [Tachysurus ichikawai]
MAGIEKTQYQWVERDCCVAYIVPDHEEMEHLNWDAWQTGDGFIAEATSGDLRNACALIVRHYGHQTTDLLINHSSIKIMDYCAAFGVPAINAKKDLNLDTGIAEVSFW